LLPLKTDLSVVNNLITYISQKKSFIVNIIFFILCFVFLNNRAISASKVLCGIQGSNYFSLSNQESQRTEDSLRKIDSIFELRQELPNAWAMVTNLPRNWWNTCKYVVSQQGVKNIFEQTVYAWLLVDTDFESWQIFKKGYEKYPTFKFLCDVGEGIGDGKTQFGISAAFALYGFATGDTVAKRCASQITEVILSCGAVVQLLKHTTGRESPFVATSKTGKWVLFPNQIEYAKHVPKYDAFPSGHVATATATYYVIQRNYPEITWLPYVGIPVISLVAVGLVGTSIHWWSDIPLGIALGYFFANMVSPKENKNSLAQKASNEADLKDKYKIDFGFNITPNGTLGLGINVQF